MDKTGKSSLQEILKSKNDLRNRIRGIKSHSNLLLEKKEPWDLMHEMFNNIELLILFGVTALKPSQNCLPYSEIMSSIRSKM